MLMTINSIVITKVSAAPKLYLVLTVELERLDHISFISLFHYQKKIFLDSLKGYLDYQLLLNISINCWSFLFRTLQNQF